MIRSTVISSNSRTDATIDFIHSSAKPGDRSNRKNLGHSNQSMRTMRANAVVQANSSELCRTVDDIRTYKKCKPAAYDLTQCKASCHRLTAEAAAHQVNVPAHSVEVNPCHGHHGLASCWSQGWSDTRDPVQLNVRPDDLLKHRA